MKRVIILIFCIFLSKAVYARDKVSISFFLAEPHIMFDNKSRQVSGAIYDFIEQHMSPEMNIKFQWDSTPSNIPRQLKNLEDNKIDAVALLAYTPERAEKYLFTEKPYTISKTVLGVMRDNPLNKVDSVEDILGLKIGYASNFYLSPFVRDKRINFEFISSYSPNQQNLVKLLAGRIDAVYIPDKAGMLVNIRLMGAENKIKVLDLPDRPGYFHVVFSKKNQKTAELWNKVFNKINGQKIYSQIQKKYTGLSDD